MTDICELWLAGEEEDGDSEYCGTLVPEEHKDQPFGISYEYLWSMLHDASLRFGMKFCGLVSVYVCVCVCLYLG